MGCFRVKIFPEFHNINQIELIKEAFDVIDLANNQKLIIKHRFTSLLEEYGDRSLRYSISFHILRMTITIGSLIVPAILSVQFTGSQTSATIYWIVWFLSLLVTISNALLNLLKVDKKYYVLNTVFHHIVSEGWLFIELSGKYSGFKTPGEIPTHKNQFVYFCHSLEKIRMKQVQDEYFKLTEIHNNNNNTNDTSRDQLIPPTPLKALQFSTTPSEGINSKGLVNETVRRNTTVLFTQAEDTEDSETVIVGTPTKGGEENE